MNNNYANTGITYPNAQNESQEEWNFRQKILIVEDDMITAMSLEETLLEIGYKEIDIARNPSEAKKKLDTKEFNLAIIDINLSQKHDGIDLAQSIRLINEHLPIVFLTGNSDNHTISKAKEVEPNAYILKPFNSNEIKVNLEIILFRQKKHKHQKPKDNELSFSKYFLNNNPNLILRIGIDGYILFVNPAISRVTGKQPQDYESCNIYNSGLEQGFINFMDQCLQSAKTKKRKHSIETNIPTIMGERMVFVVILPEFNLSEELSSVILLLQDITDQKIATMDLTNRNKKITESINYSKKIQKALLSTNEKLSYYIPDSNILLLPKDVISGDFPWVYKRDHYLYIAAIDCTGHGVPGALLSIIIHFLLNEIIKIQGSLTPAKMLETLHVLTKRNLKQHMPEVESNDGADIGICRLDLHNNELLFSGAHRPLYYLRDEEIIEIKGDRQPIGGEQYGKKRRRLSFTDHSIACQVGDKFLLFSDGISDQFGGDCDKPLKFGATNVKKILQLSGRANAYETILQLENTFKLWKRDQKQLDDAVAICFVPTPTRS